MNNNKRKRHSKNDVWKKNQKPPSNKEQEIPSASTAKRTKANDTSKSSNFFEKMRARLSGGYFRMINEKLYTCTGKEALDYFRDSLLFNLYHAGYRTQMSNWPEQPVNVIIKWLKKQNPSFVVADFGCVAVMSSEKEASSSTEKRKLSCTACFDALWLCFSPVHQMQQYYRLGALDNCGAKWKAMVDCLMLKTKPTSQIEEILEAREKSKKPHIWIFRTRYEASQNWQNLYGHLNRPK